MEGDQVVAAGIQHVALEIERGDAERAAEFWRLVGFVEVSPPPSLRERAIWMQSGSATSAAQIHLLFTDPSEMPPASDGGLVRPGFGGHVATVVADYDSALAALREAGFPIEDRRPHWGAARAYAAHPGGHTVELMAAPPRPS